MDASQQDYASDLFSQDGEEHADFFSRMEAFDPVLERELLDATDRAAVKSSHAKADLAIRETHEVQEALKRLIDEGSEMAASLKETFDPEIKKETAKILRRYYSDITRHFNERYGTHLEALKLLGEEYPIASRYDRDAGALLSPEQVASALEEHIDGPDMTEAGRRAVIEGFAKKRSSWGKNKVGKSYIDLGSYVSIDEAWKNRLPYKYRNHFTALAAAIWLFEKGENTPPSFLLGGFRGYDAGVPLGEDIPFEGSSKIRIIQIYGNGKVRLRFEEEADIRAFAQMFGIE